MPRRVLNATVVPKKIYNLLCWMQKLTITRRLPSEPRKLWSEIITLGGKEQKLGCLMEVCTSNEKLFSGNEIIGKAVIDYHATIACTALHQPCPNSLTQ